jgi:hypothetical protein
VHILPAINLFPAEQDLQIGLPCRFLEDLLPANFPNFQPPAAPSLGGFDFWSHCKARNLPARPGQRKAGAVKRRPHCDPAGRGMGAREAGPQRFVLNNRLRATGVPPRVKIRHPLSASQLHCRLFARIINKTLIKDPAADSKPRAWIAGSLGGQK